MADGMDPSTVRTIAKEATIYGFPLVDNHRMQHSYFVDAKDPQFKAPWNALTNVAHVFTPDDTAIQTPNSDTPYSFAGLDRRALQDRIVLDAGSAEPFVKPDWDITSLQALTTTYAEEAKALTSYKGLMGPRGKVDEARRHLVAAAGWGLNPDEDATYLNYSGAHDPAKGYKATYAVPENHAFWSITVYGADGYMKADTVIVNSSTATFNKDGTFTVYFGSKALCGDVPNRLDVSPVWNFVMRIYRPGPSVLDGSYKLPTPQAL